MAWWNMATPIAEVAWGKMTPCIPIVVRPKTYCLGCAAKDNAMYRCGNAVDNNTAKCHDGATENNAMYCRGKAEDGNTYR